MYQRSQYKKENHSCNRGKNSKMMTCCLRFLRMRSFLVPISSTASSLVPTIIISLPEPAVNLDRVPLRWVEVGLELSLTGTSLPVPWWVEPLGLLRRSAKAEALQRANKKMASWALVALSANHMSSLAQEKLVNSDLKLLMQPFRPNPSLKITLARVSNARVKVICPQCIPPWSQVLDTKT